MNITVQWLEEKNACSLGIKYFKKHNLENIDDIELINYGIEKKLYEWTNWLLSRLLNKIEYVKYAAFSAELVLPLYEFPDNKAPYNAIQATKKYLKNPCEKNAADSANINTAAYIAKQNIYNKILNYGLELLKKELNK